MIYLKLLKSIIFLGMNQILLRVKTNPFYVVSGLGVTIDEAVEKDSFNFLSLIQKLCSR